MKNRRMSKATQEIVDTWLEQQKDIFPDYYTWEHDGEYIKVLTKSGFELDALYIGNYEY